jgi:murein DD-endopeptidase MepM/ murein hydrolase activator NlpD
MILVAAAFAAVAGTARADTFGTPSQAVAAAPAPLVLPSAEVPNAPGSLLLPAGWTSGPAAPTQQLDFASLRGLWQRAGAAYGIPWQVLAAINKVESNFGRNMGPSSAGAVGWMQFMPSTWLRWGLDANGDRLADPWTAEDAVFAAARYLAAAGGRTDVSRAIFAYNHAQWYVDDVMQLAKMFHSDGQEVAFTLDRVQQDLASAELAVVRINQELVRARAAARAHEQVHVRLTRNVARQPLLSAQLSAQKQAALAGVEGDRWTARVRKLERQLAKAEAALVSARAGAQGAAFGAGGESLVGAPAFDSGYVFPVGGGPNVVSVGHTHHDYPAADIAAPAGSPLYALADGVVERAWQEPDARCGIGFTIRTSDGQAWTYCHLAYLSPTVRDGAVLAAGAPVGLVGSTGHATGPHLHLQLHPPTSYPQEQPWFQAFAGRAFRWSDAPTLDPPTRPVEPRRTDVFGAPAAGSSAAAAFTR